MGASRDEQKEFHLLKPQDYFYLNQVPLNAPPSLSPLAHIHTTLSPRTQVWFTLNSPIFNFFIYKAVTSQNGKSSWKHCVKDLIKQ